MKTRNVLVVIGGAICLALSNCNSDPKVPEGEYLIEGELENVPDSTVVGYLKSQDTVANPLPMTR